MADRIKIVDDEGRVRWILEADGRVIDVEQEETQPEAPPRRPAPPEPDTP